MKPIFIALCVPPFLALLAACQQQVLSRRDTLSEQFNQMNKSGWAVDDPSRSRSAAAAAPDPNVRVVREADFSGYQFRTSFQVDDARLRTPATAPAPSTPPANPPPTVTPWGAFPTGH